MLIVKKKIFLQKRIIFKDFLKYKQNLIFYPKIKIKNSQNFLVKLFGKLSLDKNKFSINFFLPKNTVFPKFFNISFFKSLGSLKNKQIQLKVLETSAENKEELREFLISTTKHQILKDLESEKNYQISFLFILSSQTSLLQIIRKLSGKLKKKTNISPRKKKLQKNSNNLGFKLKYGKFIMPADHRNNFKDGNIDDIIVYGKIGERYMKISKNSVNCNIMFITPRAIKKKKRTMLKFLSIISICFIDSFEIILMQNIENFFFILKNLIKLRLVPISSGIKPLFELFISSTKIPDFYLKLFSSLSFSGTFFSKYYKNFLATGIIVFSKKFIFKKNVINSKTNFSTVFQPFELKMFEIFKIKGSFNLLIFSRKYSELIPIRNILQKIKKKFELKITLFNEYTKDFGKSPPKLNLNCSNREIVLITEKWFFFVRFLFIEFDSIYFHTYPDNREIYYELLRLAKF